jgi:hypothetical protein
VSNVERRIRRGMKRRAFQYAKEGARLLAPMEKEPHVWEKRLRWAWVPILGPLVRWFLGRGMTV